MANLEQQIIAELKKRGIKVTQTRKLMGLAFARGHHVYTAREMLDYLARLGHTVNKTTVYRELSFLTAKGFLRTLIFQDSIVRYEVTDQGNHHHHLVCQDCGEVTALTLPENLEGMTAEIKRQHKFRVTSHTLEFFGHCHECLK